MKDDLEISALLGIGGVECAHVGQATELIHSRI